MVYTIANPTDLNVLIYTSIFEPEVSDIEVKFQKIL